MEIDKLLEAREKVNLATSKIDYKKKQLELKEAKHNLRKSVIQLKLQRVDQLKDLMGSRIVDDEGTIFPSEVRWVNSFDSDALEFFKSQILSLIKSIDAD